MGEPVLQTAGLSKTFGALVACADVSLDVRPGEIHAIIGPNGAGKSTLLAQISGTLAPDYGAVRLCGRDITTASPATRARAGLGRTFQISALAMEDTVLQNACLGACGAQRRGWQMWRRAEHIPDVRETALAALAQVGLQDQAQTRTSDLSHGQRRQLEVAVALTLRPKVLVMDEPMAGMGMDGSAALGRLLREVRDTIPILLVEHDMDAVFSLADRVSVLVEGRVIAQGTVADIRADPKVRAAYLGDEGSA